MSITLTGVLGSFKIGHEDVLKALYVTRSADNRMIADSLGLKQIDADEF
jgi:hypothetical protein